MPPPGRPVLSVAARSARIPGAPQLRGGRGVAGARLREGDGVEEVVPVMDHDTVLCFHPDGLCRSLKAHQVPEGSRTSAGTAIVQARPNRGHSQAPCNVLEDCLSSQHRCSARSRGTRWMAESPRTSARTAPAKACLLMGHCLNCNMASYLLMSPAQKTPVVFQVLPGQC